MTQPLTQRSFLKGLDASTDKLDQPRGSLPRLSNLLFTRRGSLITVDGSQPLTTPTNKFAPAASQGSIIAIQQFLTGSPLAGIVTPSTTYLPAGTGTDQMAGGANGIWGNPGNITKEDGLTASTSIFTGFIGFNITHSLIATNFNFNIPLGATINGIQVKVKKYQNNAVQNCLDSSVKLVIGGVISGTDHSNGIQWPTTLTNVIYGSNVDLWGLAITPAQVNAANFGVAIQASTTSRSTVYPNVDVISIAISYTGGAGAPKVQTGQSILYLQDPNPGSQLAEVTGLVAADATGGTLVPTTNYTYVVVALDGRQNATSGVTVAHVLGGGQSAVKLTWNIVPGASSYLIYGDIAPITNASNILGQVFQPDFSQNSSGIVGGPITVSFTDLNGAAGSLTNVPYGTLNLGTNSTIGAMRLFIASSINPSALSYNDPIQLALFPCRPDDTLIPNNPPLDASGHLLGASCPIPQMIQFANLIIIALGNGLRPQSTDGTTVTPFTNTFTATYVKWVTGVTHLVGDIINPTADANNHSPGSVDHIYKCTQGGAVGGAQPTFPTTTGQVVADGQALWVEAGLVSLSPPPRGAAHIASHAGSLWFLNTQPSNSADNLDGPSILGMSDSNNVKSFNPINRAFIGKDDGSEGMGLASFTIAEFGIAPLGSLLVFKDFNTYQIVGVFGASDFTIQALQTNMGCVAPRSIKFISGYGVIRFSHLGFALCDGVRDKLISEQIRPFIFGSPSTGSPGMPAITGIDLNHAYLIKADEIVNPPLYAAAAPLSGNVSLNRIFVYDLVLKSWAIIDLPLTSSPSSYISSLYQARTPGIEPVTLIGGFDDGSIQVVQNGQPLWQLFTSSSSISWALTTPEVFNTSDPSAEIYASNLLIRGTNLDGNPITVTLNINNEGGSIADNRVYNIGTGEFQLMIGIHEQAISFNAIIAGTGRVELESFTWNVQPKTSKVPALIT